MALLPAPAEARRASLDYRAPATCPDEQRFLEHVSQRATRLELEAQPLAQHPDQVQVRLEQDPSGAGWIGELRIAGTGALVRHVRGTRCEDVAAALALITVLRFERPDTPVAGGATALGTAPGDFIPAPAGEAGGATAPAEANAETPSASASPELDPATSAPEATQQTLEEQTTSAADTTPAEAPEDSERAEPPTDTQAAVSEPENVVEQPATSPRLSASNGEAPEAAPEPAAEASAASSEPLAVEVSALGRAGYMSVPSHAFKAALGAELRLGPGISSWSGALALAFARGNDVSRDGTAELTLLTAELHLCPPGVAPDASFWLRSCVQLRGGRIDLSLLPSRRLETWDVNRPWAALGPSIDLGVPLSSRWTLQATTALMLHLIRDSFDRDPTPDDADPTDAVRLYRPEALSIELLLGIGYTF